MESNKCEHLQVGIKASDSSICMETRCARATIGKNWQWVTIEPVEFEKWSVEVQDCMKITNYFRGIYEIYPNLMKENRRMSTCNRLDLQTLGSQPFMLKNLPNHWCKRLKHCPVFDSSAACQAHLNPSPFAQKPPKFCLETILPYILACHMQLSTCPLNFMPPFILRQYLALPNLQFRVRTQFRSPINVGIFVSWGLQFPHVHEVQEILETHVLSSFLTIEATLISSVTGEIVGHNWSKP